MGGSNHQRYVKKSAVVFSFLAIFSVQTSKYGENVTRVYPKQRNVVFRPCGEFC